MALTKKEFIKLCIEYYLVMAAPEKIEKEILRKGSIKQIRKFLEYPCVHVKLKI